MRALTAALALALALAACAGPPTVGTTASELVTTLPTSVDFGSVQLGAAALPRAIAVLPQGLQASSDTILSITESCSAFTLDLSTLESPPVVERVCEGGNNGSFFSPPGPCDNRGQTFSVGFTPAVVGAQSCVVTIAMDSGQMKTVTVTGTGTAPPVALVVVTPAVRLIDFGEVVATTPSSSVPVILRGDGTEPATYEATAAPSAFVVEGAITGSLSGGGQSQLDVSCLPTAAGAIAGTLTITSNDPDEPTITIALACEGIVSALALSPSPVQFEPTLIGGRQTAAVMLRNTSGVAMSLTSITIEPDGFVLPAVLPTSLSPVVNGVLVIEFRPDAAAVDTDVAGTLTVIYGPPAGQVRTVSLVGPARRAELSLDPGGDLDFGTVCEGASRTTLVTVTNPGTGGTSIETVEATGTGFQVEAQGMLPTNLPPAATQGLEVEVTAKPATGESLGTMSLISTIPDSEPVIRNLRAVGLAAGIGADPAVVAFDGTPVGGASGVRQARITNCDPAPITIVSQGISGPDAADFFVTGTPIDLTLALGETATWLVELRPGTAGAKQASLDLVHAGGVISVPLTGVGDGPLGGGRGSYYACSTGGGRGSWWLLALALVPLVRRRGRRELAAGA